jgi:4-hydroxy-3-polyprenylbenzoate decarboxylase
LYSTYRRVAVALGINPDISYHELVEQFGKALRSPLVKPEIVGSGVCQQHVLLGEAVNLLQFPIPKTHSTDGGPYQKFALTINTGVTKDPDSDWVNWGSYRGQLQSKNSTGLLLQPLNHGGQIFAKYCKEKRIMEYASFQNADPLCFLIGASGVPFGVSEVDVVGGIRRSPVKLVKCKTVDLYVPADAEFVVEGTVTPGDVQEEGPFGEYPGYTVSESFQRPVFRISAITHRDEPILSSISMGIPQHEVIWGLQLAGVVTELLKGKGLPIGRVAVPSEAGWHAIVVSTATPYAGIPFQIAFNIWSDRVGKYFPYVIVTDEDVDPANLNEVLHAVCTKCEPQRAIHILRGTMCSPLTPMVRKSPEKDLGFGGSNVLLDCTWPFDWKSEEIPIRESFNGSYPESVKANALRKLKKVGLAL